MKRLAISLLALCATACTSVEPLRPDMHSRPVPSRPDEVAMINGMRAALEADGRPLECYRGEGLKAFRPKFVQGYRDYAESDAQFSACPTFASLAGLTDDERSFAIRSYLDNGFGLVDLYCNRFFMIAAETRQSRQIQRSTGSALDTLVTSVLTAFGAGQTGLGVLNNGFEAFDATYRNIDAAFLVAPDRDDLIALVTAAQDKIRADSYKEGYQTYPAARSAIERYASKCTFDGMKDLVGTAMRNAAKAAKEETDSAAPADERPADPPAGPGGAPVEADAPSPPAEGGTDADLLGSTIPG